MEEKTLPPKGDALTRSNADEFLKIAEQFRLGKLPTESTHPKTINLSADAKSNISKAISSIKDIDQSVFKTIKNKMCSKSTIFFVF